MNTSNFQQQKTASTTPATSTAASFNCPFSEGYAESGLANLSEKCNPKNNIPTGRTFRARIERLDETQIQKALTNSNDQVLQVIKSCGLFRRKAVVAIDYT